MAKKKTTSTETTNPYRNGFSGQGLNGFLPVQSKPIPGVPGLEGISPVTGALPAPPPDWTQIPNPNPPQAAPAPQQLAPQSGGGGVGLPPLSQFTQAYDQAAQTAQQQHDAAIPQIAAQYAQLRDTLSQQHDAAQAQLAQSAAAALAERQGVQQQLATQTQPAINDLQGQLGGNAPASAVSGVAATNALQQQNLALQAQRADQLNSQLQATYGAADNQRQADTQLAQAGATSAADANLRNIINSINTKKADIALQYAQQQAQLSASQANGGLTPYEAYQVQRNSALDQQNLQNKIDPSGVANQASQGALQFIGQASNNASSYPSTYAYFTNLFNANAGDPAKMQAALTAQASKISAGNDPAGGKLAHPIDPSFVANWINEYAQARQGAINSYIQQNG